MAVNGISPYDSSYMFRPQTKTTRPSPSKQEELNLKVLDQTEQTVMKLRKNYQKVITA